jgi:hypothetical protein
MKKLALLQLLLLPLAGLAEAPKSVEAPAAVRCEEPGESGWESYEAGAKDLAKRLVGFALAMSRVPTMR